MNLEKRVLPYLPFLFIIICLLQISCIFETNSEPDGLQSISQRKLYFAQKANSEMKIDGILDENAWKTAQWSEPFVDILGVPIKFPNLRTQVKVTWDMDYLYVSARLMDQHIWATLTEKNSYIWRYDNDFEFFIDPDRDHHNYYELEINALNTIWELSLDKPYRNSGNPRDPHNLPDLKSAVYIQGSINNPETPDTAWTVELAFPWKNLQIFSKDPLPPQSGDRMRVNFSRVHWVTELQGNEYVKSAAVQEYNMCWSPQGKINMHMPEKWGELIFVTGHESPDIRDLIEENRIREELMEMYYLQKTHFGNHQIYAVAPKELAGFSREKRGAKLSQFYALTDQFRICLDIGHAKYLKGTELCVDQDSKIWKN